MTFCVVISWKYKNSRKPCYIRLQIICTLTYRYREGNIPIIILSLNDGQKTPAPNEIPDRTLGCWESKEKCIWEYNCASTYNLEENCTDSTLIQNDGTSFISQCLFENIKLFGPQSRPHYIKNNLARTKIETNTPKTGDDPAAQKNAYQWDIQDGAPPELSQIWDEIWTKWVPKAKNATKKQCGFGFLFDVHGYPDSGADQLGYLISDDALGFDNKGLNQQAESSSLKTLVGIAKVNLTDLIKGPNSIGTIMSEAGWDILPSKEKPVPESTELYYSGGWSLINTINEGFTSAAQIEISETVKTNMTKSQRYCKDLANAISQFVDNFYNTEECSGYGTQSPTYEDGSTGTPSPSVSGTNTLSILGGFVFTFIGFMYHVF